LIEVERNDLDAWFGGNAVELVALEQLGNDDIGVRVLAINGGDCGDGFASHDLCVLSPVTSVVNRGIIAA